MHSMIVFIFPFYWIITGAFKTQTSALAIPPEWWPNDPTSKIGLVLEGNRWLDGLLIAFL